MTGKWSLPWHGRVSTFEIGTRSLEQKVRSMVDALAVYVFTYVGKSGGGDEA